VQSIGRHSEFRTVQRVTPWMVMMSLPAPSILPHRDQTACQIDHSGSRRRFQHGGAFGQRGAIIRFSVPVTVTRPSRYERLEALQRAWM